MAESGCVEIVSRRSSELSNLRFALIVSIPVLLFLLLVVAYPLGLRALSEFQPDPVFRRLFGRLGLALQLRECPEGRGLLVLALAHAAFTVETVVLTLVVGMALALILKRLPQGWRWLRALIILPGLYRPMAQAFFFGYLGRGQTGVGTALANMFGSSATMNFISARFVIAVSGDRSGVEHGSAGGVFSSRQHA